MKLVCYGREEETTLELFRIITESLDSVNSFNESAAEYLENYEEEKSGALCVTL